MATLKKKKVLNLLSQVDTLKLKMEENIQLQLDNCVALEDIQEQTEGLMEKAGRASCPFHREQNYIVFIQPGVFRKNAKTLKKTMKCKDHKVQFLLS